MIQSHVEPAEKVALSDIQGTVNSVIAGTPVIDMHTHLFAPQFGAHGLWGVDELITYHYLIAELFRSSQLDPDDFFKLDKQAQADLIWKVLFVENTPLSEATRGVVAVFALLGLDPSSPNLTEAREFFAAQRLESHLDRVLKLANVEQVVMTNDLLDEDEMRIWDSFERIDSRFRAAIRMDGILNDWDSNWSVLRGKGLEIASDLSGSTLKELRSLLDNRIERLRPLYLAVSLPDTFAYPDDTVRTQLISNLVLPVSRDHRIPFALMIGVRRQVNPRLRLAGDGVGRVDIDAVNRLCSENPDNRFLVSVLSRENQHELCVSARKFANLMPFGCWWFLNNPSIIEEVTRERFELLGATFIAQHSDARILEQLLYKWQHSREIIASSLAESYERLIADGFSVTRAHIERDARKLLSQNFADFVGLTT
jgi:hypothetical protein